MKKTKAVAIIFGVIVAAAAAFIAVSPTQAGMIYDRITVNIPGSAAAQKAQLDRVREAAIAVGKDHVRAYLKDPQSAQFGNEFIVGQLDNQGPIICGTVNARNAFGGYVGVKRFIAFPSSVIFDEGEELTEMDRKWGAYCRPR